MLQERASPRWPFGHQVDMTLLWWDRRLVFRGSPATSTKPEGQTKPILPGQANGLFSIWMGRGQDRGHNRGGSCHCIFGWGSSGIRVWKK